MGLIREPKNVDFTSESKPWTEEELADFRKLMKMLKAKKQPASKAKLKVKSQSVVVRKKRQHA
jgi:hypothetical protein